MNRFIFSRAWYFRIPRHLAFWAVKYIYSCIGGAFLTFEKEPFNNYFLNLIKYAKKMPLLLLEREIVYTYVVVYLLVPFFFFRKKYIWFVLLFLAVSAADFFVHYQKWIALVKPGQMVPFMVSRVKDFLLLAAPATCIVFLAIKMYKTWYLKEQEKQMLLKANADAEIQILKAQVQPHFLFNTLNNIYSFILNGSNQASELVTQLMELLKYMTTDCNAEVVSLKREISMLCGYIGLEKVRYGNNLELIVDVYGDYHDKLIAPLLMLPLVENAFKHGASKVLVHPFVKLKIGVIKDMLVFEISNNKSSDAVKVNGKSGIGLKNVEKRLKLLYHDSYSLKTSSDTETFLVYMTVPLARHKEYVQNLEQPEAWEPVPGTFGVVLQ